MIKLSPTELFFPDPEFFQDPSGIIAYGGDLSPERLWFAYQNGIFPWFDPEEEILWWFPNPRFVLFPEKIRVSKSMKKILDRGVFTFTENGCFREVMKGCQSVYRPNQDGTWISDEMIDSYSVLNKKGLAKSIEVWQDGKLVGGFYGVVVGKVFCGESMFSTVSNASKAGFLNFVMSNNDHFELIDCQTHTDHLESLGAEMIPALDFLKRLRSQKLH